MADDKSLKDKIALLEKELVTVTERLDAANSKLKDVEDIKLELKGLKLFMGRVHPDFKSDFPEIVRKIKS